MKFELSMSNKHNFVIGIVISNVEEKLYQQLLYFFYSGNISPALLIPSASPGAIFINGPSQTQTLMFRYTV